MGLIVGLTALTSGSNEIALNWIQPLNFNFSGEQIIITRTNSYFPMELYNSSFPNTATDPRGIEIFRGSTIVGNGIASTNTLTDSGAPFPPLLVGRLVRDANSQVFKILSNTSTVLTLSGNPVTGVYVVLPDFPSIDSAQQNFENDPRTTSSSGEISNLVQITASSAVIVNFIPDSLANQIFVDGAGTKFVIKGNDINNIYFFDTVTTVVVGVGMHILEAFVNSEPMSYIDNFKSDVEAAARMGNGLLDNTFYYYTGFTLPIGGDVAQAEFGQIDSGTPTQTFAISAEDRDFGGILYNLWPSLQRELDTTEDLQDLMAVFGNFFSELHSYIDTYTLQDPDKVLTSAVLPLSEETGLPTVGYSIGADTLRRIAREMLTCWKLKGSKEGIARFIRVLTTWDITNGTGDFSGSISDFLPNIQALRFFDVSLGITNTRLTQTSPLVPGGRFVKGLPGIVIPGFFTFREFVVTLPHVALYVGTSTGFSTGSNTTTMVDSLANFGATNSLIGNFLLPNQEEVNDIFEIISNTSTSITVNGIINNRTPGGSYAVLSPLNTKRFTILNKLLVSYIPYNTKPGFNFT